MYWYIIDSIHIITSFVLIFHLININFVETWNYVKYEAFL